MNVEQLKSILSEYPMSLRLDVIVERTKVLETTVAEMVCKLMPEPQNELLTFFGRSNCIIRERGFNTSVAPPYKPWIEIDLR